MRVEHCSLQNITRHTRNTKLLCQGRRSHFTIRVAQEQKNVSGTRQWRDSAEDIG